MTKVKICGITNLEDALAAVEYGADAIGFVFAPSPRQIKPEKVREITAALPPFVSKVGVFVSSDPEYIRQTMSDCDLNLAQLHGDESPEDCAALFPRVIKSFTIKNLPPLRKLSGYRAAAYVIDKEKGSSDAAIESIWQAALKARQHGRVILAGGLTPENVGRAIETARPYAVDVASGVETKPGKKDHARLRDFIAAAKNVGSGDIRAIAR